MSNMLVYAVRPSSLDVHINPAPCVSPILLSAPQRAAMQIICGGVSATGALLNDVWLWDGRAWSHTVPQGPLPAVREMHSCAVLPSGAFLIYGGRGTRAQVLPPLVTGHWHAVPCCGSQGQHSAPALPVPQMLESLSSSTCSTVGQSRGRECRPPFCGM